MKTAQDGYFSAAGAAEPASKIMDTSAAELPSSTKAQHFGDWPNDAGFNAPNETRGPVELNVKGTFPPWTAGTLLRAGPGSSTLPRSNPADGNFNVSHWFDGFAHIHKFDIVPTSDGSSTKVFYRSRSHMDEGIEEARRTDKLAGITFAQKRDPCDTLYRKFKTIFEPVAAGGTHTENLGVVIQPPFTSLSNETTKATTMTVTSDKSASKSFSLETLEPLGVVNQSTLHPTLKGPLSGAHACIDAATGEIYNYNLELGPKAIYRIFCTTPPDGTAQSSASTKILAAIADTRIKGAYIHSMLLTTNYVILCIWPAYYSHSGLTLLWERNILDAMAPFDAKAKCKWFVIDRHGARGVVKKFTSPAMFCFHTVNAWEEPSMDPSGNSSTDIIAELCTFENTDILHRFYYENLISSSPGASKYSGTTPSISTKGSLRRYRLGSVDIPAGKGGHTPQAELIRTIPSPDAGDLPTINPHFAMRRHRYTYSLLDTGRSSFIDAIAKTDCERGTAIRWMEEKCTPGEAVFVPRPGGMGEDDGVLLSVVLNGTTGRSFLLCLNARDLREMARAECEVAVGIGFHGVHLAASQMES